MEISKVGLCARMGHARWVERDTWATWSQTRAEGFTRYLFISVLPGRKEEEQCRTREIRAELKGYGYWRETESVTPSLGVTAPLWDGQDAYPRARNSCSMFLCQKITHMP